MYKRTTVFVDTVDKIGDHEKTGRFLKTEQVEISPAIVDNLWKTCGKTHTFQHPHCIHF